MHHHTSRDLKEKFSPFNPSIDIKYSTAKIDIDKLWFTEPFFQLPNTLYGFYNKETKAGLCILFMNATIVMLISDAMFYYVTACHSMS